MTSLYSLDLVQQYLQRTPRMTVRAVTALQDIDDVVYIIFVLGQLLFDIKARVCCLLPTVQLTFH